MLPSHHWARNLTVEDEDTESLVTLLLDKETPLTSQELTRHLVQHRLEKEAAELEERYKDVRVYVPSETFDVGQKLVFPALDYATAVVKDVRPGNNPDYGEFKVITVEFDENGKKKSTREFAIDLDVPHKLSEEAENGRASMLGMEDLSVDEILEAAGDDITANLEEHLLERGDLAYVTRKWFPRDLMLEVNDGHLNLAEAVLDIAGGGPLPIDTILEQIGGLGDSPQSLQEFSLNYTLNEDPRFDEVGPAGEVLWYLTRLQPEEVQETPELLRYSPFDYDRSILTDDMLVLEAEIGDELSPLEDISGVTEGTVTLIYPHRRSGTLPLNAQVRHIFPFARRTPHIWITLVDGQDGEEYEGWVVPEERYVFGLDPIYQKHSLPIGAYVTVSRTDEPDKIRIDLRTHRPRTEWVRLIIPSGDQLQFENNKRSIGVEYDDLMILGVDDLEALDSLVDSTQKKRRNLAATLRMLVPALGRLTPQGTVHVRTLYSAVNVLFRCPPGPIMATMQTDPDFENVGGHYWRLVQE